MTVAEDKFVLTRGGYEQLQQQLAELEKLELQERDMLNDSLSEAIGRDDSPDAAVEFDSRSHKAWTEEKIAHLKFILERSELYEDPDPRRVNTGERVSVWDCDKKEALQFDVISSAEVAAQVRVGPGVQDVSNESPIGQALIGRTVGDVVDIEIPDGKIRYILRGIQPIPEKTS